MSLIWDYLLDGISRHVHQVLDTLAWKKVLLLAKVHPFTHALGSLKWTELCLWGLMVGIGSLKFWKPVYYDPILLQYAINLTKATLIGWLFVRRWQGKISDQAVLLNLTCNILSSMV